MDTTKHPVAQIRINSEVYLLYPGQQVRAGRSNDNDLIIADPKVSRNHAQLEWTGTGFNLRDLGSVNGTFINGERITSPCLLHDGDEIALSKQLLYYEIVRVPPGDPIAEALSNGKTDSLVPRRALLMVSQGPDRGQEFPLWGECIVIGRSSRDATWEIRLSDRSVSRPHLKIIQQEGQFSVIDLESANGTTHNGARVQRVERLKDGDVLGLGETVLIFHDR